MKAEGMVDNCYYDYDYFAGAVKQCGGKGNMPTASDLEKIARAIYEGNPSINSTEYTHNLTYKPGTATSLGLPEPDFYLWSGWERTGGTASYRSFYLNGSVWSSYANRNYSYVQAVCLGD